MQPLGTEAPSFALPDVVTGRILARDDARGPAGLLLMFLCVHCPFVQHLERHLGGFARDCAGRGLGVAAVSSNDIARYPADAPEGMRGQARAAGFSFPYLYDETQQLARASGAVCTPDFFLYDAGLKLVYRGRFDASRPGMDLPVTGEDLRRAVEALLAGAPPLPDQRPSLGCSIKWREDDTGRAMR
jgi:peroxiredoxin